MKPYESKPHVPPWIAALNGELLTPAQLEVLDFIHWCKRFGCRTSNDRIAKRVHCHHLTVQRAVQELHRLDLIAIDNPSKRTRVLKPVPWPDREAWEKFKKLQAKSQPDGEQNVPHIPILDKSPPTGVSSIGGIESTFQVDDILPGGGRPQPPAFGSGGGGSSETSATPDEVDIAFTPQGEIPEPTYQEAAIKMRDQLIELGHSAEHAEWFVRKRYPQAKF